MPGIPSWSWREVIADFRQPQVVTMLFLGFSAGIPLLLIFSSLSAWLVEADVERRAVTFFSWAALGYSFKFVWAPLVDRLPLPWLTKRYGRRRAWLLISQLSIISAIALMASIDPAQGPSQLTQMALAAVLLGFSAATQDIVIDAYRIESARTELQAMMSAIYIAGYRIGMVVSGAGALYFATLFLSSKDLGYFHAAWELTYLVMAAMMLVGVVTTLVVKEPTVKARVDDSAYTMLDHLRLLLVFLLSVSVFAASFFFSGELAESLKSGMGDGVLTGFVVETVRFSAAIALAVIAGALLVKTGLVSRQMAWVTWIAPVQDFFKRYGLRTALLLLALIGLYRISDIVLGVISNVFYLDLGFTKPEIASAVKTFGVLISIVGSVLGGVLTAHYGVYRMLMLGAVLSALTNLVFIALAHVGSELPMLYFAVGADNLAAGLASAAFVAFLSSLTSVSFTAVQYAIFSSLMTLIPKVLGGYSGSMVDSVGYPWFFTFTTVIGIPVLFLVWLVDRRLIRGE
ncbi:MAG: AmpG family muropeptide MFS transporter [bacterium]